MSNFVALDPTLKRGSNYLGHLADEYWSSILPGPDDERIADICQEFMGAKPDQRNLFSQTLSNTARSSLAAFAFRMAMLVLQRRIIDV